MKTFFITLGAILAAAAIICVVIFTVGVAIEMANSNAEAKAKTEHDRPYEAQRQRTRVEWQSMRNAFPQFDPDGSQLRSNEAEIDRAETSVEYPGWSLDPWFYGHNYFEYDSDHKRWWQWDRHQGRLRPLTKEESQEIERKADHDLYVTDEVIHPTKTLAKLTRNVMPTSFE